MVKRNWLLCVLMPMLLPLLVTACAQPSIVVSPPPKPPSVPSLPSEARVSLIPVPSICAQGCSVGIRESLKSSESMLTNFESGAKPASDQPTR